MQLILEMRKIPSLLHFLWQCAHKRYAPLVSGSVKSGESEWRNRDERACLVGRSHVCYGYAGYEEDRYHS